MMLIVVKVGGSILKEETSPDIVSDVKNLLSENRIILVHGGGKEVTEIASKLGKEQKFVVSPDGFSSRYTDRETVEKRLVIVDERGRKRVIDGGYTGKISKINTHLLRLLVENGYVPVVAPVATGEEFEPLNVDGDRTAAYIAGAIGADRLILLTDVEGLNLNGKLVSKLNLSEVKGMLPKIGRGMITKVYAAMEALNQGVGEVVISSGLEKSPISSSLKNECGTVISRE